MNKLKALALMAAISAVSAAQAAGVDISAETTQAKTDVSTAGGLIIGVMVSIAVIAWIRRVVK